MIFFFKRFWFPKWFWQNFCHKKSTHLNHSYLKYALDSRILGNFMQLSSNDTFAVFTVKLISCKNYGAISVYETPCVTASSVCFPEKESFIPSYLTDRQKISWRGSSSVHHHWKCYFFQLPVSLRDFLSFTTIELVEITQSFMRLS